MDKFAVCVFALCLSSGGHCWSGMSDRAKISVDYLNLFANEVDSFIGNQTHPDHFKLLKQDGDSLLIGARNMVYNISLPTLQENVEQRVEWTSRERDREICLMKGKDEDDCNNYIRVLAKTSPNELLVCGTNSFNPRCRYYTNNKETGVYSVDKEFSGRGYCPYDPRHNSTSIFTGGSLYSGTVSDFSGTDALIIKDQIRTEQYNLKHLNGPDFVGSAEDEDFVYFFFREDAVEYMNCGKNVFSRVGRVCKGDEGGPRQWTAKWTTFVKSRLNCSVPGTFPFYFDEIQSISQVGDRIFGVFNTPDNSIPGSAVCSFSMADIADTFAGPFKVQNDADSNWLPVTRDDRPGSCRNKTESADLTDDHLNFIKENVLMDAAVPAATNIPHFVKTSPHERLTTIAVDPDVMTADGRMVDVLFVGTTRGRVLKMASFDNGGRPQTNLIEDLQLFPYHVAVNNILVVPAKTEGGQNGGGGSVVALSEHEVKSVPVHRCGGPSLQSCADCVGLQDPYCAWNVQFERCELHTVAVQDTSSLLQQINTGLHQGCPVQGGIRLQNSVYDFYDEKPFTLPREHIAMTGGYSGRTLAVGCLFAALIALVVGLGSGHLATRRYLERRSYLKCGHAYLEAQALDRSGKVGDTSHYTEPGFVPPKLAAVRPSVTTKNNLLANIPEKVETLKNNISLRTSTFSPSFLPTLSNSLLNPISSSSSQPSPSLPSSPDAVGKSKKIYL